tara:strand:- start:339 stop:1499 length:1161 start_codon:yes stop_codon:yes gene_type:complete
MNIQPAEGPTRFQRGVDMISNVFKDTGSNIADYMKASSDARDGRFFSAPNAYDSDMAKFPINQGAGALEFFGDLFQLPFESGAQLLGYDQFGSGQGSGDMGYMINQFLDSDAADREKMAINSVLEASPLSLDYAGLVQDETFQNFLRGQGINVTDDFDIYRDIVKSDDQATMDKFYSMSQDPESPYYTNINKFKAADGMEPYNQALEDQYNQYLADEANKFMESVYPSFAEAQTPFMVDQLATDLGVSPTSAESILMGGSATDFGLLNDLMNYYEGPLEYTTPEGQALFGDDLVTNLAGGVASLSKTGKVLNKAKKKLRTGRTAAILEQLYPGTFGGKLEFPVRFGKDGSRLNFGILSGYPKTSGLIRSPLQAYGVTVAPDFVSGE